MSDTGKDDGNIDPQGAPEASVDQPEVVEAPAVEAPPAEQPQTADMAAREALLNHGIQPPKKKRGFNPMGPGGIMLMVILLVVVIFVIGPENLLSGSDNGDIEPPSVSQVDESVSRSTGFDPGSLLDFDTTDPVPDDPAVPAPDEPDVAEAPPIILPDALEQDVFERRITDLERLIAELAASPSQGISTEQLERVLTENAERVSTVLQRELERSEKERERIMAEAAKRTDALEARLAAEAERAARDREAAAERIAAAQDSARQRAEAERKAAAERIAAAQEAARERAESERKAAAERIAAAEQAAADARAAAAVAAAAAARPSAAGGKPEADPGAEADKKAAEEAAKLEARKRASPTLVLDLSSEPEEAGPSSIAGTTIASADDAFLAQNASQSFDTAVSTDIPDPSNTVVQGTIISGVIETALSSELPGVLRAQVTEPVFSFDGNRILIPSGTTLIGSYRNKVVIGQSRLLVAWNRAITPEGQSIALGSVGTDTLGRSGMAANVNNRLGQKFGMAALISVVAIAPELAAARLAQETNTDIDISNSDDLLRADAADEIGSSVADELGEFLGNFLDMPPLLRVAQGEEIRVLVNRDLVFR